MKRINKLFVIAALSVALLFMALWLAGASLATGNAVPGVVSLGGYVVGMTSFAAAMIAISKEKESTHEK